MKFIEKIGTKMAASYPVEMIEGRPEVFHLFFCDTL
jgi:hypothetical protein